MVLHTYRVQYINIVTSKWIQLNTQNIGYVCYPQLREPCTNFNYFTGTLKVYWYHLLLSVQLTETKWVMILLWNSDMKYALFYSCVEITYARSLFCRSQLSKIIQRLQNISPLLPCIFITCALTHSTAKLKRGECFFVNHTDMSINKFSLMWDSFIIISKL